MPDEKQRCDLSGTPADKRCIFWLLAFFLAMALILPGGFVYSWISLQEAIEDAGASHLLNNVVATIGGDSLFAVKRVEVPAETKTTVGAPGAAAEDSTMPEAGAAKPDAVQVKASKKYILLISDSFAVLIVFISGAFGGFIHASRSFYYHVHKGDLQKSNAIELMLRPLTGGTLALIFYLVLRAGLSQSPSQPDESGGSIIFYTAVGAIVGMFTDQTVAKLKKIAEAILTSPEEPEKDKEKADATG
ncbi:hypothetical protein BerOc1_02381 [Pseudodesulfovibrio hydrargyri]|uniref:Uncharacterized protein n=1 Tax=Pseudodesulfovibrio hydrargyri TaxID=2125990 RepID=A0A1J5MXA2_9BACT|nr:hypothetical protein [Pseudodesulfovibrio hydrargyri]OIQ50444.1 hypothetical protein BerOc1_02381 [Pseudodesulfovibrio hydrargyri]